MANVLRDKVFAFWVILTCAYNRYGQLKIQDIYQNSNNKNVT